MSDPQRLRTEPRFFSEVRHRLVDAEVKQAGVSESWVMPAARYDARAGFGEESWLEASPETVIAWRLSGPDIACHWGPARGRIIAADVSQMALQPKGTPNHYTAAPGIVFGQVCIPDALLSRVGDELGVRGAADTLRDDLFGIEDQVLFGRLNEYLLVGLQGTPPSRIEMEARALLIVDRLLGAHHAGRRRIEKGGLPFRKLRLVTEYLMAHLAEDVALPELAAIADLSPYHFCRAFRQSTGLPPHAWLTVRRVERAQEMMLAHREMGLTEIALCVGYSTQAAFGVAFRRVTGATPGQWRRERAG